MDLTPGGYPTIFSFEFPALWRSTLSHVELV